MNNYFTYLKSNKNYWLLMIILCAHNNRLDLVIIAYTCILQKITLTSKNLLQTICKYDIDIVI